MKDVNTMVKSRQVRAMGTVIDISLPDETSEELMTLVETRLREYEYVFSANDASSELMAVNSNAEIKPVTVRPELFHLIKLGLSHSLSDHSRLNIAIGPLVQTWRIGFSDAKVPSKTEIQQQLALTNPKQILLDDDQQTIFLTKAGMKLDLGSLAKGYIADLIVAELQQHGVYSGLLNLGGNILTFGLSSHSDGLWRIGIRDPSGAESDWKQLLKVGAKSVVTSGIYERTLKVDNQRYHHIFDPLTGYPAETDVASLTIVSDESVTGEIWTTRLFGYPTAEILRQVNATPEIEALILLKDGTEFLSIGMKKYL
ncbi:FAD:protein FMN transferase [Enterococcus dongliensis]|nr:FAD:protein FMN transferase [Enterococcus dongliensis]